MRVPVHALHAIHELLIDAFGRRIAGLRLARRLSRREHHEPRQKREPARAAVEQKHGAYQPSERLVELVHTLWDSGELFLGANLAHRKGAYEASGELLLPAQRTLVAKRIPVV